MKKTCPIKLKWRFKAWEGADGKKGFMSCKLDIEEYIEGGPAKVLIQRIN